MAEAAIERGSFYVGNNIEIALHPYSPQLQMAYAPQGGRARIKIYGLPLQHWNRYDMNMSLAGFGYPLRVAPYFTNGNYQYLTMLVACKKPGKIPLNLKLRVNPYKKTVRLELDGWLINQGPPPPPPQGGDNNDRRDRGRSGNINSDGRGKQSYVRRSPGEHGNRGAR